MQVVPLMADNLHFYIHERGLVLRPSLLLDLCIILCMSQERSAAPEKSDRERYCDGYTKEIL